MSIVPKKPRFEPYSSARFGGTLKPANATLMRSLQCDRRRQS
jgi:hypothetical protein